MLKPSTLRNSMTDSLKEGGGGFSGTKSSGTFFSPAPIGNEVVKEESEKWEGVSRME